MKTSPKTLSRLGGLAFTAAMLAAATAAGVPPAAVHVEWQIVANNAAPIPGTNRTFNSYNPPSVNDGGLVVFRARSKGPQPVSGVYTRRMKRRPSRLVELLADRDTVVPQPNNTFYAPAGQLATFTEFPSFPRIAMASDLVASRANHQPVWTYLALDPDTGESVETRVGTNGIYARREGDIFTVVNLLGEVEGFERHAVPGWARPIRFDVFPGSPAVADERVIVFKGNFTDNGNGRTGIYWRDIDGVANDLAVHRIADTTTPMPNLPAGADGVTFGSTAPPSAAGTRAVFVGYDDERSPLHGGIYLASLEDDPPLTTLVDLHGLVPVTGAGSEFSRIGEALSFNGRYVAFWASWGETTRTLRLYCPQDGNADRRAWCSHEGVSGDPASVLDPETGLWYQDKPVPLNQGIFVHDVETRTTRLVARTGDRFADFLYWNYSGAPPGVGHGETDAEPPRWRAASFIALGGRPVTAQALAIHSYRIAFLARRGALGAGHTWIDPVDGLYLGEGPGLDDPQPLLQTGMDGSGLDPLALDANGAPLAVSAIGLERDGLRGDLLVVSVAMGNEETGWAGVYLGRLRRGGHD